MRIFLLLLLFVIAGCGDINPDPPELNVQKAEDEIIVKKRFWWSQKQYERWNQSASFYSPLLKPKTRPNEVLVDGEWLQYSAIMPEKPNFDDVELIAELLPPIRIKVEGIEQGLPQ